MIRLFKHYVPHGVLLLGLVDAVLLLAAAEMGWVFRARQIGMDVTPALTRAGPLVTFAASLSIAMVAVGVYAPVALRSMRQATARLLVATALGVVMESVLFFLFPSITLWRSNLLYALALAVVLLFGLRAAIDRWVDGQAFKRCIVVLGAGPRAARLKALAAKPGAGFSICGFVAMTEAGRTLTEAVARPDIPNLADHVMTLGASEVVLAIEERRNALPLADLLRIKTTGVHVTDLSSFLERETGRVDLASVNPSWLIFSDGFSSGRMISGIVKRVFDIAASLALLVIAAPLLLMTAIAIRLESRGPIFYRQRRVGLYGEPFDIPKFRSMRTDAEAGGKAVWAAKKDPRVTRVGRVIRLVRIDEIPQAWSVLKGEMSFVGPRPERPQFVGELERDLPFYAERHMVKPGITGWAQINYPYGASTEDARHKLEYDLYYAKNYSPFLDLLILLQTLRVVIWPEGSAVTPALVLPCWALAALLFGLVALAQLRRAGEGLPRRAFVVALLATALWALTMAGLDGRELGTRVAEGGRTLAWLGFMWALARRGEPHGRLGVAAVYAVVAAIVLASIGLAVGERAWGVAEAAPALTGGRLILRMMAAVSALVLTHHLHAATTGRARGGLRLVIAALAAMWAFDLAAYSLAYLLGAWPPALVVARAVATLLLAPVIAVAAHRDGEWTLQLSRTVALQSLSVLAVALYLGGTLFAVSVLELVGGAHARVWQTAFVFGTTTALLTLLSNPWLRAWVRVKLAKHLFRHRYDYRAEWVRFTDTLGVPGAEGAPLDRRIVKAVADLADAPAGLLLVPDGAGLGAGAGWNWDAPRAADAALARHLAGTARIIELDAVRAGTAAADDCASTPDWMLAREDAWVIAPLLHFGELVGAILLARPLVDRALDWEDFDLLRIAGRQVASYLAEARAAHALAEARRFDEFNRRFAFILHDIKNLVSQTSLVARNAERHAENPAFRADMIATLKESADKMNALLARLSQRQAPRAEPPAPVAVLPLIERVARAHRRLRPITTGGPPALAMADAGRLEQLLGHLVQNAVEASAPDGPVGITAGVHGPTATIEVADRGPGMSAAFVRDELFRPFHSTKPGGFGIGAYEARQLAEAMGGTLSVESCEGEGTRFTVRLPAAQAMEAAA